MAAVVTLVQRVTSHVHPEFPLSAPERVCRSVEQGLHVAHGDATAQAHMSTRIHPAHYSPLWGRIHRQADGTCSALRGLRG